MLGGHLKSNGYKKIEFHHLNLQEKKFHSHRLYILSLPYLNHSF